MTVPRTWPETAATSSLATRTASRIRCAPARSAAPCSVRATGVTLRVEQRYPEIALKAGDGARHGRLDDVRVAGGGREAAGLTARQEVLEVADVHGAMLEANDEIDCRLRQQPLDKVNSHAPWLFLSLYFQLKAVP